MPSPGPSPHPCVPMSPRPHPTHRYWRCDRPAKALSPIRVNLLELSRLQREGASVRWDGHRGTGMPRTGRGHQDARPPAWDTYRNCSEGMWAKAASRISVKAAFTIVLPTRPSFRATQERRGQQGTLPPPCPSAPVLLAPSVCQCPLRVLGRGQLVGQQPHSNPAQPHSSTRGWHPPHMCPRPVAPRGLRCVDAHTRACRHTDTHTHPSHSCACTRLWGLAASPETCQLCSLGALVPKVTSAGRAAAVLHPSLTGG